MVRPPVPNPYAGGGAVESDFWGATVAWMGLMVVLPKRVVSFWISGSLGFAGWEKGEVVVADEGPKLNTGPELPMVPNGLLVGIGAGAAAAAVAEGAAKLNAPEVAGLATGAAAAAAGAGFGANDGIALFGSSNLGAASGALTGTGFGCCCGC